MPKKESEQVPVNQRADALASWEAGLDLCSAALRYSEPGNQEKYRSSRSRPQSDANEYSMYIDLYSKLMTGELTAYGIQISPDPRAEPEQIPRHFFGPNLNRNLSEWQRAELSFSAWKFEAVRIVEPPRGSSTPEIGEAIQQHGPEVADPDQSERMGRRSTYEAAKEVFVALGDSALMKPAERLLQEFNAAYLKVADGHGLPVAPIAERTLRGHLKRYRRELAETGRN